MKKPYHLAQQAMADLKEAVHQVLQGAPTEGLSNAQIGRILGIYGGHIGHEGHISRTLLELMASEGVASQDTQTKKWHLRNHIEAAPDHGDG